MSNVITLHEFESKPYKDIGFKDEGKFISYVKELNRKYSSEGSGDTGIFTLYRDTFKATNYVGFGLIDNVIIQVVPKVYESESDEYRNMLILLKLFDSAFKLNIKDWEYNKIPTYLQNSPSFYEVLIFLFAKSLLRELENGFYKEYISYRSSDTFLRGKLIVKEEVRKLPHQYAIFYLEKTMFNRDNLLNRIFYYTCKISIQHTKWRRNRILLDNIMDLMDEVKYYRVTYDDISRIKFNRLNQRFRPIFELAKIIIAGLRDHRESDVFGFFVDMNRLFETHIYTALKRNKINVKYQYRIGPLIEKKGDEIPDFVVYKNDKPVIVLDAKYKIVKSMEDVNMNDIRQVYTYLKILKKKSDGINKAILIYPALGGLSKDDKFQFFDKDNLIIMYYDLSKIAASKGYSSYDEMFIEKLKDYMIT